jgi:pimeloyl-ACP methyl ester carboxylesterase
VETSSDVLTIANDLSLTEFAVLGISGGAPHALACAANLSGRIRAAAVVVPIGPADAMGAHFYEGMASANVQEFGSIRTNNETKYRHFEELTDDILFNPSAFLRKFDLSASDERRSKLLDFKRSS